MKNFKTKLKNFLLSTAGRIVLIVVIYVIIISVMGGIVGATDNMWVSGIILLIFGYFGWNALNSITPDMFLFMSAGGWLVYYLIKGILSLVIGLFVAPFYFARKITEAISEGAEIYAEAKAQINAEANLNISANVDASTNITINNNSSHTTVYEVNMQKIATLPESELEKMHEELLTYVQHRPVPTEGVDYMKVLREHEMKAIAGGGIYGCTTYGEAESMNKAIVKRLDELDG